MILMREVFTSGGEVVLRGAHSEKAKVVDNEYILDVYTVVVSCSLWNETYFTTSLKQAVGLFDLVYSILDDVNQTCIDASTKLKNVFELANERELS